MKNAVLTLSIFLSSLVSANDNYRGYNQGPTLTGKEAASYLKSIKNGQLKHYLQSSTDPIAEYLEIEPRYYSQGVNTKLSQQFEDLLKQHFSMIEESHALCNNKACIVSVISTKEIDRFALCDSLEGYYAKCTSFLGSKPLNKPKTPSKSQLALDCIDVVGDLNTEEEFKTQLKLCVEQKYSINFNEWQNSKTKFKTNLKLTTSLQPEAQLDPITLPTIKLVNNDNPQMGKFLKEMLTTEITKFNEMHGAGALVGEINCRKSYCVAEVINGQEVLSKEVPFFGTEYSAGEKFRHELCENKKASVDRKIAMKEQREWQTIELKCNVVMPL